MVYNVYITKRLLEEIMRNKFKQYEALRQAGLVNMYDKESVCYLANITEDDYFYIIYNYTTLKEEYDSLMAFYNLYEEISLKEVQGEQPQGIELDILEIGDLNFNLDFQNTRLIIDSKLSSSLEVFKKFKENDIKKFYISENALTDQLVIQTLYLHDFKIDKVTFIEIPHRRTSKMVYQVNSK